VRGVSNLEVELVRANEGDAPVLARLFTLYFHDMSEFFGGMPDADGRFGVPSLEPWWREPERRAYRILAAPEGGDLRPAGFALVRRGSIVDGDPDVMDVAEFFVVRGARRRGVGQEAARQLFTQHPGRWDVRVFAGNRPALPFWRASTARAASRSVAESAWTSPDGRAWNVLRFSVDASTGGRA
jgi:predicted acetyltransferase